MTAKDIIEALLEIINDGLEASDTVLEYADARSFEDGEYFDGNEGLLLTTEDGAEFFVHIKKVK